MNMAKKNWFRKHLVLTIILGIMLLIIFIGMIGSIINGSHNPIITSNNVTNKISNFTLEDCMSACNSYCLQAQVDTCQTGCSMVGKPGQAMDKIVNTIKNVTKNLSC